MITTPYESTNSRSTFYNEYYVNIEKVKMTENNDLTGSIIMANLNPFCKFFELSMDKRRHLSAVSLFGSMLPLEELSVHSTAIFLNEAEVAGSGICSLTIILTDKHDFGSGVSRQFHRHFLLLLDFLEL